MVYCLVYLILSQTVRRLALSAMNSAARTKPHLIREHLPALLPGLYQETHVNSDLVRTVQMGPWTHKVDDGLDTRKTAYETMYTLVSAFYRSAIRSAVH
jgi:cullin-associated NEDD8-dissociated protein 1